MSTSSRFRALATSTCWARRGTSSFRRTASRSGSIPTWPAPAEASRESRREVHADGEVVGRIPLLLSVHVEIDAPAIDLLRGLSGEKDVIDPRRRIVPGRLRLVVQYFVALRQGPGVGERESAGA